MTTYEITFNERSKIGKSFLGFIQENKKYFKIKDPTEMTREEFFAKLDKAKKQCERGECTRVAKEELKKFLGLE